MAQPVIRAAQTSYELGQFAGGTMEDYGGKNIANFVDSIELEETKFLNSLKKGSAGNERKEYFGGRSIMPRGSRVSAATLSTDTSIPIVPNHGARFQQGHVILVTNDAGAQERMWVVEDPASSALVVQRAQGGSTAIALEAGNEIKVIGVAMPQLSDFPLSPVTRGKTWWTTYQQFSGHIEHSHEARYTQTEEIKSDRQAVDMLAVAKSKKIELNAALVLGGRQEGDPDPSAPNPSMLGGLMFWAYQAGNVFSGANTTTALTIELVDDAINELDTLYGDALGRRLAMSPKTKRVFNRLAAPMKFERGMDGRSVDLRWDTIETDIGEFKFTSMKDIPDGKILVYQDSNHEYAPFTGADWKEKDFPTKGLYYWRGISGEFTYRPKNAQAYAVIDTFSMNLADYPSFMVAGA